MVVGTNTMFISSRLVVQYLPWYNNKLRLISSHLKESLDLLQNLSNLCSALSIQGNDRLHESSWSVCHLKYRHIERLIRARWKQPLSRSSLSQLESLLLFGPTQNWNSDGLFTKYVRAVIKWSTNHYSSFWVLEKVIWNNLSFLLEDVS